MVCQIFVFSRGTICIPPVASRTYIPPDSHTPVPLTVSFFMSTLKVIFLYHWNFQIFINLSHNQINIPVSRNSWINSLYTTPVSTNCKVQDNILWLIKRPFCHISITIIIYKKSRFIITNNEDMLAPS